MASFYFFVSDLW